MKIAFTSKGTQWESEMDPRFGRASFFILYDEEKYDMGSCGGRFGWNHSRIRTALDFCNPVF